MPEMNKTINLDIYRELYSKLNTLWSSFPKEFCNNRPNSKEWTALEVLSHLADTEGIYFIRFRQTIAEEQPKSLGFEQENWAKFLSYNENDPSKVLELIKSLRNANHDVLSRVPDKFWNKTKGQIKRTIFGTDVPKDKKSSQ